MLYTKEQKKEAYKKLSPEIQDFIMSSETTELINKYLNEIELSDDQNELADSQILYAMIGLQSLDQAISNIATLSNRSVETLSQLKSNLQNEVFYFIQNETKSEQNENQDKNGVGNDFEQIILNQARAMQVAKEVPENLPIGENVAETTNQNRTVHDYKDGNDPYREPIS